MVNVSGMGYRLSAVSTSCQLAALGKGLSVLARDSSILLVGRLRPFRVLVNALAWTLKRADERYAG